MWREDETEAGENLVVEADEPYGAESEGIVSPPRRRWRPRLCIRVDVGEWYGTLAIVGALVGLFVAGLLVALNQAFPEGGSGGMNAGVLTGVSIAIIVGTSLLGVSLAGLAQFVGWGWKRARGRKAIASDREPEPVAEAHRSNGEC